MPTSRHNKRHLSHLQSWKEGAQRAISTHHQHCPAVSCRCLRLHPAAAAAAADNDAVDTLLVLRLFCCCRIDRRHKMIDRQPHHALERYVYVLLMTNRTLMSAVSASLSLFSCALYHSLRLHTLLPGAAPVLPACVASRWQRRRRRRCMRAADPVRAPPTRFAVSRAGVFLRL